MKEIGAFLCFRQQRVVIYGLTFVNHTGLLCQVSHRALFMAAC